MKKLVFYRCRLCGNIVCAVENSGVIPYCCGSQMEKLKANTVDAAFEKHVPVITKDGMKVTVKVGETEHPMTESHYIKWIFLVTCCGTYAKKLEPEEKPEAVFCVCEKEKPLAAYEYCSIHGLWLYETDDNKEGGV